MPGTEALEGVPSLAVTSEEKRQRHKARRRSRVEAARLAQARADRRRRVITLGVVLAFVVIVVGGAVLLLGDDDESTASDDGATTLPTTAPSTASDDSTEPSGPPSTVALPPPPEGRTLEGETPCPATDGTEERVAQFAQAPPMCIDEGEQLEAVIAVEGGEIVATLDTENAPTMVNNFVVLARYKYFDGLPFHRLVPDFVAQGGSSGIPDYGSGGPGYDMPDIEKPTDGYAPGDLAMARSTAVSGSQFFIVASENGAAALTNEYPKFGQVTSGLELVQLLAATGDEDSNGAPTQLITIQSVTIRPVGG